MQYGDEIILSKDDDDWESCAAPMSTTSRRISEVYDVLLRISETRTWSSDREELLRHIRLICRRADVWLFGDPSKASAIRSEIVMIFPELFRLQSFGVHAPHRSLDRSESALVWVRDSLTRLCDKLERKDRSRAPIRQRTTPADNELVHVPWHDFL